MTSHHVPYFQRAPVVERVLGVQFQPISGFHAGLLGAYWKMLGEDWPSVNEASALEPQFVEFDNAQLSLIPRISFTLMQTPACRLQMLNRRGDRMIQLQNGRFHLNWKGTAGEDYPRYPQIREEFDRYYGLLVSFLSKEVGCDPATELWEVTYLNHLPKSTVWSKPSDWQALFPSLVQPSPVSDGLCLETFNGAWQYEIHPRRGRLYVELRHGRQDRTGDEELLVFTLTARGPLKNGDAADIDHGLNLGRFAIANAFTSLTSESAHSYWGRRNETS